MKDQRLEKLARVLVEYSTGVKPGDNVCVSGEDSAIPFIKEVAKQAILAGGNVKWFVDMPELDEFLLKNGRPEQIEQPNYRFGECARADVWISAWGTDNKYLFSLYQGENLSEEQSVVGEIDKDKVPITGNSRFGCWCCTMVKEDKSLQNFIDHGATELIPLRRFRNWLVDLRANPEARDWRRRNGSVYFNADGEFGRGPFTLATRREILRRLLLLEDETGFSLITMDELKVIDKLWEDEGDLTRRALVDVYYEVRGQRLPWDQFKHAKYDEETIASITALCGKYAVPFELVSKLLIAVDNTKFYTRSAVSAKEVEKIMNQGWLHYRSIQEGLDNEN